MKYTVVLARACERSVSGAVLKSSVAERSVERA